MTLVDGLERAQAMPHEVDDRVPTIDHITGQGLLQVRVGGPDRGEQVPQPQVQSTEVPRLELFDRFDVVERSDHAFPVVSEGRSRRTHYGERHRCATDGGRSKDLSPDMPVCHRSPPHQSPVLVRGNSELTCPCSGVRLPVRRDKPSVGACRCLPGPLDGRRCG